MFALPHQEIEQWESDLTEANRLNSSHISTYCLTFEEDTVSLAKEVGFKHVDTWWLSLSTQQGKSTVNTLDGTESEKKQKQKYIGEFTRPDLPGRKFEPTFIFEK